MVDEKFNDIEEIEQMRKDNAKNTTLWIVIAVAVIAILAFAGWWYLRTESQKKKTEKVEPAVQQQVEEPGTEPEKTEPDELALTEDQEAFNRYFTDELLRDQLKLKDAGWDLSMFRKLVGNAFSAEFLTEMPGMTWEKWENTRKEVLDLARKTLAQPEFLRWLWEQHDETVLSAIRMAGKEPRVSRWAKRAQPYFSGALPMAHSKTLNEYYEIDKKLEQELKKKNYDTDRIRELTVQLDQMYRKLSDIGLDRDDIYLFEFSRRRLAEGGRDLLQAYADILADLSENLEHGHDVENGD